MYGLLDVALNDLHIRAEGPCAILVAWKSSNPDHGGFAFPKGSRIREIMQYQTLKMFGAGIFKVGNVPLRDNPS